MDLHRREVTREEALSLAKDYSAPYFETSALDGENVDDLFQMATRIALNGAVVAY